MTDAGMCSCGGRGVACPPPWWVGWRVGPTPSPYPSRGWSVTLAQDARIAAKYGSPNSILRSSKIETLVWAMSFDAFTLFTGVMDPGTAETLAAICRAQGLGRAIDVAMIDDSMASELLQQHGELREPLMRAIAAARPLVGGWATSFRLKGEASVGGGSGGGSAVSQLPLPSAPCSDGAPARLCVQGTRSEPSVAPGSEPTAVVRSSRLLLVHQEDRWGGVW